METPASGNMGSAYSMLMGDRTTTRIAQGMVASYDALSKSYTVNVDRDATRSCRRLSSGVDSPFSQGARVLLLKCYGVDWIILGELEKATNPVPVDGGSADEQAATLDRAFNLDISRLPDVGYRAVDSDGIPEDLRLAGDLVIENKTHKHVSRSSIKIHSFGDIFTKASNLCFEHFHKKRNTIIRVARNLRTTALGYTLDILTSTDKETAGEVSVEERIKARADDATDVIRRTSGTIPDRPTQPDKSFSLTPIVVEGHREETGNFLVVERDAVTETVRFEQRAGGKSFLSGVIGGTTGSDEITPASLSAKSGIGLKFGNFQIVYNAESNQLEITSTATLSSKLVMAQDRFAIEVGDQKLEFTESGMKIQSNNLDTIVTGNQTTKVSGSVEETASGAHTVKALTINLN
jgi:hypothetical protein